MDLESPVSPQPGSTMKHAALVLLSSLFLACGGVAPRSPAVSVGSSPAEVEAPAETAPAAPAMPATPETDRPTAAPELGGSAGLFLTDGEGHRFSVETIRTSAPSEPSDRADPKMKRRGF